MDVELHGVDAADGIDGVFDALGDLGLDFLRGGAGIRHRHDDGGQVDFREEVDAQGEEREDADHHQRDDQHGGEDGTFDAECG